MAVESSDNPDQALIDHHREAYSDYLKLNLAIWGTTNMAIASLGSTYSANEMLKLQSKYAELCKLNIALATTLQGLQTSYKEYFAEVIKKLTTGVKAVDTATANTRLLTSVKQCPGLSAKVRFLGTLIG